MFAALDFSSGTPVAIANNTLNTIEGCASICDNSGNLLFYTDGSTVWNKNQQVMPNGTGLLGGSSSTQAALIIPQPGTLLYYIFTTDETGGPNGLRYSVVDMTLQSGVGDVTQKNVLLLNNVTEKLTAVSDPSGSVYRVAAHEWGTDAFYVYTINASGLLASPVITNTGMVHSTSQIQNTYGQMKFSPDRSRIALAAGYLDTVEVFNFNFSASAPSNPVTLPMGFHVYGLEFSPDGCYLYITTYDPAGTLVQLDLSSGNAAAILASKTVLSIAPDTYALQLAPDDKIYVCKSWSAFLGVIHDPNLQGTACNYVDNGFDLDPNFNGVQSALGLPAFAQSYFGSEGHCPPTGTEEFFTVENNFIYPNPASATLYVPEDAAEAFVYNSTAQTMIHIKSIRSGIDIRMLPPGLYLLRVKYKNGKYFSARFVCTEVN